MKTNELNRVNEAILLNARTFSQAINAFKKSFSNRNIVESIKNYNKLCDKHNLGADKRITVSSKDIADIANLVARKDFYQLIKFGMSKVDDVMCDVIWLEKFSNFDSSDEKFNKKYIFTPKLSGKNFKPFGFKIDKKTGGFVRDVYNEVTEVCVVNQNDNYTTLKYCYEKEFFTHGDIFKVVRAYLVAGCPEIEGVKYSDIRIERKNGKKDEPKKEESKKVSVSECTNENNKFNNVKRDKYKKLILLATNKYRESKDNRTKEILEYLRVRYKRETAA